MGVFSREKGQSLTYGFGLPPCLFHHDLFPLRKSWFLSIPVFYHVKPSDVGHQSGSFEDAFFNHEKGADQEKKELIEKEDCLEESSYANRIPCG